MKGLYHRRILPAWLAFADAVGRFIEELIFRSALAFDVLTGRTPQRIERRWWNRAVETPVLVDVFDWTDERLVFSVLVWPSLEAEPGEALHRHEERVEEVLQAISRGAAEMAWSTRYEVDYGLWWDHERQVWVAEDGYAYDGAGFAARRSHAS